jgi:hypothetical protein
MADTDIGASQHYWSMRDGESIISVWKEYGEEND